MPSLRAATRRWWPPITVWSSLRAMIGSISPNSWMLRVSASSSASEMRLGLKRLGCRLPIATWLMIKVAVLMLPMFALLPSARLSPRRR